MQNYPIKRCSRCQCHIDHRAEKCVACHNQTKTKPFEYRFFRNIKKTSHCWIWKKSKNNEYGKITFDGKEMLSHRASWIFHNGPIKGDLFVLHNCLPLRDNRACVNPKHLWLGTARDNVLDMHKKGCANTARGEKVWASKLKSKQVFIIKKEWAKKRYQMIEFTHKMGKRFGVSHWTIKGIIYKNQWRHIHPF